MNIEEEPYFFDEDGLTSFSPSPPLGKKEENKTEEIDKEKLNSEPHTSEFVWNECLSFSNSGSRCSCPNDRTILPITTLKQVAESYTNHYTQLVSGGTHISGIAYEFVLASALTKRETKTSNLCHVLRSGRMHQAITLSNPQSASQSSTSICHRVYELIPTLIAKLSTGELYVRDEERLQVARMLLIGAQDNCVDIMCALQANHLGEVSQCIQHLCLAAFSNWLMGTLLYEQLIAATNTPSDLNNMNGERLLSSLEVQTAFSRLLFTWQMNAARSGNGKPCVCADRCWRVLVWASAHEHSSLWHVLSTHTMHLPNNQSTAFNHEYDYPWPVAIEVVGADVGQTQTVTASSSRVHVLECMQTLMSVRSAVQDQCALIQQSGVDYLVSSLVSLLISDLPDRSLARTQHSQVLELMLGQLGTQAPVTDCRMTDFMKQDHLLGTGSSLSEWVRAVIDCEQPVTHTQLREASSVHLLIVLLANPSVRNHAVQQQMLSTLRAKLTPTLCVQLCQSVRSMKHLTTVFLAMAYHLHSISDSVVKLYVQSIQLGRSKKDKWLCDYSSTSTAPLCTAVWHSYMAVLLVAHKRHIQCNALMEKLLANYKLAADSLKVNTNNLELSNRLLQLILNFWGCATGDLLRLMSNTDTGTGCYALHAHGHAQWPELTERLLTACMLHHNVTLVLTTGLERNEHVRVENVLNGLCLYLTEHNTQKAHASITLFVNDHVQVVASKMMSALLDMTITQQSVFALEQVCSDLCALCTKWNEAVSADVLQRHMDNRPSGSACMARLHLCLLQALHKHNLCSTTNARLSGVYMSVWWHCVLNIKQSAQTDSVLNNLVPVLHKHLLEIQPVDVEKSVMHTVKHLLQRVSTCTRAAESVLRCVVPVLKRRLDLSRKEWPVNEPHESVLRRHYNVLGCVLLACASHMNTIRDRGTPMLFSVLQSVLNKAHQYNVGDLSASSLNGSTVHVQSSVQCVLCAVRVLSQMQWTTQAPLKRIITDLIKLYIPVAHKVSDISSAWAKGHVLLAVLVNDHALLEHAWLVVLHKVLCATSVSALSPHTLRAHVLFAEQVLARAVNLSSEMVMNVLSAVLMCSLYTKAVFMDCCLLLDTVKATYNTHNVDTDIVLPAITKAWTCLASAKPCVVPEQLLVVRQALCSRWPNLTHQLHSLITHMAYCQLVEAGTGTGLNIHLREKMRRLE